MLIRRADSEDLVFLLPLLKQLFSIEADFDFDERRQLSGLRLLLNSDRTAVFVAEVDGLIVGMVTGQIVVSTAEGSLALLLEDLIVDRRFRGKRIGSELLSEVSLWSCRYGVNRIQLLADQNNIKGLAFYRKTGWKKTDLICLRKYLKED